MALFSVALGDDLPMGKRSARTSFGNVGMRVAEVPVGKRGAAKQADAPTVTPNSPQLLVAPFDQTTAKKGQEAWAANLKTPSENANSIGMKLRLIPPGEYMMGSTKDQIERVLSWGPLRDPMTSREQPAQRVRIVRPFYLGVHEVTRGEFAKFVAATGYKADAERDGRRPDQEFDGAKRQNVNWRNPGYPQADSHPVVDVTGADAIAFCEWLSRKEGRFYRLPKEAEWEHACRAGTTTLFYTGDDPQKAAEVANMIGATDGYEFTAPVGSFPPNPFGLYDTCGNVWELCQDWSTPDYVGHTAEGDPPNSANPSMVVARGGAADCLVAYCRSAIRDIEPRSARSNNIGFRVACEIVPVENDAATNEFASPEGFAPPLNGKNRARSKTHPIGQKLLVVVAKGDHDVLQPFVAHKEKLLPTELVALQVILKESTGADDAEKLKRYLYRRWQNNNVGYVLLVGDAERIPVRFAAINDGGKGAGSWTFAPSDLYFADLAKRDGSFEDWNAKKDQFHADYYGELMGFDGKDPINADQIDYLPEIAVGRWPVHTRTQLQMVVAKTIRYEKHVLADDLPVAHRTAFVNGPGLADVRGQMTDWAKKLEVVTSAQPTRLLYKDAGRDDKTPPPSVEEVEKALNGGVGMIFHVGHGTETRWDGCLDLGRLRRVHNAALAPVMFSIGCSTARYAPGAPGNPYVDIHGKAHRGTDAKESFKGPAPPPANYQRGKYDRSSLGVEFVRRGPNGAVAYIGCDTGSQGCAWPMMGGFVEYIASHESPRLGDAWNEALTKYYWDMGLRTIKPQDWVNVAIFHQGMKFQLFGDPSMQLPRSPSQQAIAWLDQEQHTQANIWGMRFSPDSRLLLGFGDAGPSGAIRIWHVATDTELPTLLTGKKVWFSSAVFAPDGKHLLSWYSQDNQVYIWDGTTSRLRGLLVGHTKPVTSVAVSPDGSLALTGSQDQTLLLWNLTNSRELHRFPGSSEHGAGTFSPDSKSILTYGDVPTLRLWDVKSGAPLHELAGHSAGCSGLFSPDGRQILSFSSDKTVRLWDAVTCKQIRLFEGCADVVWGAAFLPGGGQVVAWGKDRTLRVWDSGSGRQVRTLDLGKDWKLDATALALSSDVRRLLTSHEDQSVRLRDLSTGTELRRYSNVRNSRGLTFSPDGSLAASGSFRAGVYVLRLPE
jgi:formylglycine-generating enzyme required for sulfatase activity/WD40 repeat protein